MWLGARPGTFALIASARSRAAWVVAITDNSGSSPNFRKTSGPRPKPVLTPRPLRTQSSGCSAPVSQRDSSGRHGLKALNGIAQSFAAISFRAGSFSNSQQSSQADYVEVEVNPGPEGTELKL